MADKTVDDDLLEEEPLAENDFNQQYPDVPIREITLRHSATTDTLDSVYLEPSTKEEDLQDIITSIHDLIKDPSDSDSMSGTVEVNDNDLSELVKKQSLMDTPEKNINPDAPKEGSSEKEMNISSYFTEQNSFEDPFSSSAFLSFPESATVSVTQEQDFQSNITEMANKNSKHTEENLLEYRHLESRTSHEEPESVDFQIESTTSVLESSLQTIDDKENFEMFTAEYDPGPEYGVSPGINHVNLSAERVDQIHSMESNPNEPSMTGYWPNLDRQHSLGSTTGSELGCTTMPSAQFPSNHFSPFNTPTHQPLQISPMEPPTQPITELHDYIKPVEGVTTVGDNLFFPEASDSDTDRQHDAWLPGDHSIITSVSDHLCSPGLIVNEPQGDPVRDLVYRYMGEQEAIKRQVLTVDSVSQDLDGLKKLIEGGCYRSAMDLTGRLLTEVGQGVDKAGKSTSHTPHSLQLWFCRLTLLIKLRYYSLAESELQAFHNLDTPDLYYEYYPGVYPGKKGCMVPFGMRILHAELPHFLGRSHETLDRLYYILAVIQRILRNLEDNLAEDGSAVQISVKSRQASMELWQKREKRVFYLIGNTFYAMKDYEAAISIYDMILKKDVTCKSNLLSGIGRIYLQIGNVLKAKECFDQAEVLSNNQDNAVKCRNSINRGLEGMCLNNFSEAYQCFKHAVELDSTNSSAVNNMAVCSLYLGKLMDALKSLEVLVHEDPQRNLHEGVLFNLCTLYELESSRALHKKQALLDLVSRYKGDGFPVACLKMA